MKQDPNRTLYSFYIHVKGRDPIYATRLWPVPPRIAHRLVLKTNRSKHGSAFVRLETIWLGMGGLRAILTDDRCVATV